MTEAAVRYEVRRTGDAEDGPAFKALRADPVDGLYRIAKWKSPRRAELVRENDPQTIKWAFDCAHKAPTVGHGAAVLTILKGVGWPMASAIMTALYIDRATVLDFRAVEMLDGDRNVSRYQSITGYDELCRRVSTLAKSYGVTLRDMDRALWQLSSERGSSAS